MKAKQMTRPGRSKGFHGRLSDIDIRLLRVFRVIVESRGLSAAQVELGIGRSTISKHLSDLEQRLGLRLCDRGRAGFMINDYGREVYQAVLQLFTAMDDFQSRVNAVHSEDVGNLHLGFVDGAVTDAVSPVGPAIAQYRKIAPRVHLHLKVATPDIIEKEVLDGTLHLGVLPLIHKHASLEHQFLYGEEAALYCGSGHPLFDVPDAKLRWQDLTSAQLVARTYPESATIKKLKKHFELSATTSSTEGVGLLVLSGEFVGFLPTNYAENWVAAGKIRKLLPKRTQKRTPIVLIHRKGKSHPHLVGEFLNILLSAR
jgi:DNA-binding transcriptional LysR family regulator